MYEAQIFGLVYLKTNGPFFFNLKGTCQVTLFCLHRGFTNESG